MFSGKDVRVFIEAPEKDLLLEKLEGEFQSDPVVFPSVESREKSDVEDMIAESVAHFGITRKDGRPQLAEIKTFG